MELSSSDELSSDTSIYVDDPDIQALIHQEPLDEAQLDVLLAKVREVRASMQRVEEDVN